MREIELGAGEAYQHNGDSLQAIINIASRGPSDVRVDIPGATLSGRGSRILLREMPAEGAAIIEVKPDNSSGSFPAGTQILISLEIRGHNLTINLPVYSLAGLRNFDVAKIIPQAGSYLIQAAEKADISVADSRDSVMATMAGALHSLKEESPTVGSEREKRQLLVIRDVSASAMAQLDAETFKGILSIVGAVVKDAGEAQVMTSSHSHVARRVTSGQDLSTYFETARPAHGEVGWAKDFSELDPDAAVLVISDDIPAAVGEHRGPVHVLCTNAPIETVPANCGVTVFDATLKEGLAGGNQNLLSETVNQVARDIKNTLDQGKVNS